MAANVQKLVRLLFTGESDKCLAIADVITKHFLGRQVFEPSRPRGLLVYSSLVL